MRKPPNYNYKCVLDHLAINEELTDKDPQLVYLYHLLLGTSNMIIPEDIIDAYDLFDDIETQHLLDAAILGKITNEEINEALNISLTTISTYRKLFFDISVFRHNLDIIKYVKNLNCEDTYKNYYFQSIEQGGAYLLNKFRIGERKKISPVDVVKIVMNDQFDRFISHRGKNLTSEEAQIALKFGQQAVASAVSLTSIDKTDTNKNAVMELHLALKTQDLTKQSALDESIITE